MMTRIDPRQPGAFSGPSSFSAWRRGFLRPHWIRLTLATIGLFIIGGIIAPTTITLGAVLSMLPFIAILAVASIGQHLVMQQRGFDLSVAGAMSLAAVLITRLPASDESISGTIGFAIVVMAIGAIGGAANGLAVSFVRIPALVTTLGVNAIMLCIAIWISGGSPHTVPVALGNFAQGRTLGLPNVTIVMIFMTALVALVIARTPFGRRLVAVSANPNAARVTGVPVLLYGIFTFAFAGFCYAVAGIMLAGVLQSPSVTTGAPYVLATVAAVAVGGNATLERRASFIATVIGTIVLIYLGELVVSLGFDKAVQYVVQALVIIASVALPDVSKFFSATSVRNNGDATSNGTLAAPRPVSPEKTVESSPEAPALELNGVSKSFGPVAALRDVTVSFLPGEVHAIVGENGAGKSTLISIAAGTLRADVGEIVRDGRSVAAPGPAGMRDLEVSVAYQHPALAPDLTVLENIQLFLDRANFDRDDAERLIKSVALPHLQMSVHRRVADLSLAQRHVVEIARALATSPRVLFLDEPTEPFQAADVRKLFALINELKARGVAVVYVSHRLHEVMEIADRISVLRDGELIDTRLRKKITNNEIVTLIAGKPLAQVFPHRGRALGQVVLRVAGLSGAGFNNVDLVARPGEIIGLTGVEGQGQREFLRAVACVNKSDAGEIVIGDQRIAGGPGAARRSGISFIPDDRHVEGLFLTLTVRENIGFASLPLVSTAGLINIRRETALAEKAANDFEVKAPSVETLVSNLSGGNQQKVLFGREALTTPKVLLVDEPTRGIDIGTRTGIYRRLRQISDSGVVVIVSSSDGAEVEGLCDRVLIFARGAVVRELKGVEVADLAITEANMTGTTLREPGTRGARTRLLQDLLASDHFPAAALVVFSLAIALGTNSVNSYFLTAFNIRNMMTLTAMLAFVSAGQLCAVLIGGIDLAVGPLAGLGVVLASFLITPRESLISLIEGSAAIVAFCTLFGLFQGAVTVTLQMSSVVVTLASFIGLQGVSLLLRPNAGGIIDSTLSDFTTAPIAGVPTGMALTIITIAGLEWLLFRSQLGRQLRSIGSSGTSAHKMGVNAARVTLIAFSMSGFLTGVGALMLAAQIGIGSPVTGIDFTLMSITAVVLGGSSITGGRGSFVGAAIGCILVQLMLSASTFLQAGPAWQYGLIGATTLLAAGLFSTLRPRAAH
jgi:ribose transport system ATP-binding protein